MFGLFYDVVSKKRSYDGPFDCDVFSGTKYPVSRSWGLVAYTWHLQIFLEEAWFPRFGRHLCFTWGRKWFCNSKLRIYCIICMTFSVNILHVVSPSSGEFRENRQSENCALLGNRKKLWHFLHVSHICIQLNATVRVYRNLLCDCELRDNTRSKIILLNNVEECYKYFQHSSSDFDKIRHFKDQKSL